MISRRRRQTQEGIALILVLLLVVLTTIMIVAFLASIKTETTAVRSALGIQNSRQLADLGVQTVISQIQQATQTTSSRPAGTVSWASQPGMIRCYDNTGAEIEWYKLYSAQNMTVDNPTPSVALIDSDLPGTGSGASWVSSTSTNYGVFTDINSPVTAADGTTLEYPIMNPAAATSIASAAGTTANAVLGFDIQNPPGYSSGTSSATNNQAPMPVRWLYVLQNGAMVPGVSSGTPGIVTVAGANSTNSIVGRVAFWTDDDTCKLNINTAADGTYYDTPRFESTTENTSIASVTPASTQDADLIIDRQMAKTPPVFNESQRFIGQPAQTRLSYVLGSTISNNGTVNKSHLLTLLTPFLQWGGSSGGTVDMLTASTTAMATPARQTPYATLDEWMFSTQLHSSLRVPSPADTSASPAALLTNGRLQQLRFFLSANSDAPEVNLFGQPRICMWPIYTTDSGNGSLTDPGNAFPTNSPGTNYVTTFDRLIATAATLTGCSPKGNGLTPTTPYAYYFGRQSAASPYTDWQGTSTSPPSLNSKVATRNQNIFKYLRTYASLPIPGYGAAFTSKYQNGEMDQILTEIFDYCRSTDPADLLATSKYASSGQTASPGVSGGGGQVTPITIKKSNFGNVYSTKGFGRFDSINEISLDFTHDIAAYNADGTADTTHYNITGTIYLSLYCPSLGYASLNPHLRVVVQSPNTPGVITMNVTGSDGTSHAVFGTPNNGANSGRTVFSAIPQPPSSGNYNGWNNGGQSAITWGGVAGARQLLLLKNSSFTNGSKTSKGVTTIIPNTPNSGNYELCGVNMRIPTTCTSLTMAPTSLEIKIYHTDALPSDTTANGGGDGYPGADATDLVQDIVVQLPGFSNLPMPTNSTVLQDLGGRLVSNANMLGVAYCDETYPGSGLFIAPGDIVQSVVGGYNGDLRLIPAAQTAIDDTKVTTSQAFVPHPQANNPAQPMAHSQRDIFPHWTQPGYTNSCTGQLVPSATYPGYSSSKSSGTSFLPTVGFIDSTLAGKSGAPDYSHDWDNGWGGFPDGPFINKADEAGQQYQIAATLDTTYGNDPYYNGEANASQSAFNSPNRVVASPVMFGSLPTGVPINGNAAIPWQTLLFRPQAGHFGENSPEDELLLDWFWMPVVQPYAISTALATAGKVNMNYQIAPFTYITRATALMGVLGSEEVIAAPTTAGKTYKTKGGASYPTYRTPVKVLESDNYTLGDSTGTFWPFKDRFSNGKIFRSAAEICDIYLVPQGQSWSNWASAGSPTAGTDAENFWAANQLTGDNTRERPYNGLYSRLTTKSNTYTVHVRAQALKSPRNLPAGEWIENPQLIASEYRGSATINRYLDPQDTNIPDFLAPTSTYTGTLSYSLDNYYKYRVLEARQFLP